MHPLEPISVSSSAVTAAASTDPGPGLATLATMSTSGSRYGATEPDPFKHATDGSQCTHCGAQITVGTKDGNEHSRSMNFHNHGEGPFN